MMKTTSSFTVSRVDIELKVSNQTEVSETIIKRNLMMSAEIQPNKAGPLAILSYNNHHLCHVCK